MWVPYVVVPCVVLFNVIAYACNENSWFFHRFASQRHGWLAITNRAAGVDKKQQPASFWGWDLVDPAHCVTSLLVPQWVLLALRLSALLYFTAYFIVGAITGGVLDPHWLVYFTDWSFVSFALSMLLGTAHTALAIQEARKWRLQPAPHAASLQLAESGMGAASAAVAVGDTGARKLLPDADIRPAAGSSGTELGGNRLAADSCTSAAAIGSSCDKGGRRENVDNADSSSSGSGSAGWTLLAKAHLLTAEVAFPAELFLTAFYWTFLAEGNTSATNLMVHGINNAFMLADVALSRLPFVSYHYQLLLLYGSCYLVFMWIYHAASGEWVYSDLDWSKPRSLAMYVLLPVLLALAFFIYWGLAWARERLGRRRTQRQRQRQEAVHAGVSLHGMGLQA